MGYYGLIFLALNMLLVSLKSTSCEKARVPIAGRTFCFIRTTSEDVCLDFNRKFIPFLTISINQVSCPNK